MMASEMTVALLSAQDAYGVSVWTLVLGGVGAVVIFQLLGWSLWSAAWRERTVAVTDAAGSTTALPPLLTLFFQQVLGIGGAMLLLLGLALAGVFHPAGVVAVCVLIFVAAVLVWRKKTFRAGVLQRKAAGVLFWEWGVLLSASLALGLTAWRFPGLWDDTSYHLPLAQSIVQHHALVANEWLRFPYFPAFMQLLFAAGLLVDASLAQWLAAWPVVITLAGLMGAARWLGGHGVWGVGAWLLYVTTPTATQVLGFAYVDFGLTLFCTAGLLAAALWSKAPPADRIQWLLMAGLCCGVASGIKFFGLVFAAAVGVGVLAMSAGAAPALRNLWVFGGSCAAVCVFWYARSYWMTGDPVHPAGGRIFGFYLWTAKDLTAQSVEQASHGVPKQWGHFFVSFMHAQTTYLWGALAVPLLLRQGRQKHWLLIWLVVLVVAFFWFWVSQVGRYLMPILPLGALMALLLARYLLAWLVDPLQGRSGRALFAAVAIGLTLDYAWQAVSSLKLRPSVLAQRDARNDVALLQRAVALKAQYGAKVLNFGYENAVFYYKGQLIGDWFGPASFIVASDCARVCSLRSVHDVEQLMRRVDARLLLIHSERFRFSEPEYSAHMDLIEKKGPGYLYALRD